MALPAPSACPTSQLRASRPISRASGICRRPGRWRSGRAAAGRCRRSGSSSNQGQSGVAFCSNSRSAASVRVSRIWPAQPIAAEAGGSTRGCPAGRTPRRAARSSRDAGGKARSNICDGPELQRPCRRDRPTHAPRAQRASAVAVVRADLLEPAAVETHEVAEPAALAVEGGVAGTRRRSWPAGSTCGDPAPSSSRSTVKQQGPGVVVGAVALGEVGNRVAGVLEQAGRVGHAAAGGPAASPAGRPAVRRGCGRPAA